MTDHQTLLFELGTEELPPKSLLKLRDALKSNVTQALKKAQLSHGTVHAYATPRRLALIIDQLADAQPDREVEKRGPALKAAFSEDGTPTKATEGFARSCNTTADQLGRLKTDKGEWLAFTQSIKGAQTESIIPELLKQSLATLPVAKKMRWGAASTEFVRPVHWLVLLFGEQVLDAELLGLHSGRSTFGHRFHHPEAIELTTPADYLERLYNQGRVVADFDQRKKTIRQQAEQAAQSVNGFVHIEDALLDEVTALVEWPTPVVGSFDQSFLALPQEVLITTMQSNQKYFPVKSARGELLPHFITISNIASSNPESVQSGNERVIRPRLADAQFFWEQDRKNPLESRIVDLSSIIFQNKLGTVADKTHRVEQLAQHIADQLNIDATAAKHAALLAKADLLTEMVGEFPSLQGIMGHYYALADGEPADVAAAIEEQYLPKQSGGALPETTTGQIVALADKLDTLVAIFSIGLIPTGDKDPYALRRAALGLLRIIIEKRLDLDLTAMIDCALDQLPHAHPRDKTRQAVYNFVLDRLKGYALEQGFSHSQFEAVRSINPGKLLDFEQRLEAVKAFSQLPEAESLAAANKRIRNILRKSAQDNLGKVDPAILTADQERTLYQATVEAAEAVAPLLAQRDYTATLSRLAELRDHVDHFFDHVMVMAEEPALRQNRLALLAMIEALFLQIADIAKLEI